MSEFEGIEGFEGWCAKLQELLTEAEQTAGDEDFDSKPLRKRLHEFRMSSPNTPEIVKLDAIASATRKNLTLKTIAARLRNIDDRTSELAALTKRFMAVTEDARADARAIRLEKAHVVADALTATVKAINEFKIGLETGQDDQLLASVEAAIESIQAIRNDFESI